MHDEVDSSVKSFPRVIVSGGQTGADRAALDAAIEKDIAHGGWAPRGRWTEDGPLPFRYRLQETASHEPAVRTEWNVRDADATLVVSHGPPIGGSALTLDFARKLRKPALHLDLNEQTIDETAARLRGWLQERRPAVLNVAGPRASEDGRIYEAVRELLRRVL